METWERIQKIIDDKKLNVTRFSKAVGIGNNVTISKIIKERREPFEGTMMKIVAAFPDIRKEWILNGEGEMYERSTNRPSSNAIALPTQDENTLEIIRREDGTEFRDLGEGRFLMITPFVEQKAYGGYIAGWADPVYIDELPRHAIVVERLHFGVYRSFEVKGDSMNNGRIESYPEGSVVTGRLLDRGKYMRNKLHLHDFQDFVIVQQDGIQIKRIVKHDVQSGIITCSSLNDDKESYPDFTIHLDEVKELFNVVAKTLQTKS